VRGLAALGYLCVAAALLLAACSGAGGDPGQASLWITRDRGSQVLMLRTVPAGQTAMQALESMADVETRFGGRFVQSIDGVEGSLSGQRDWFWFVNGIEADRSAAEYRLRPGDVEWWDYRSWASSMREPVVVGAFPEPFVHGYDGKVRPTFVSYTRRSLARSARAIARLLRADRIGEGKIEPPPGANAFVLRPGRRTSLVARSRGGAADDPVVFELSGGPLAGLRLARNPALVRRAYLWP
jgi:Domain of unknown function (DUF4430)